MLAYERASDGRVSRESHASAPGCLGSRRKQPRHRRQTMSQPEEEVKSEGDPGYLIALGRDDLGDVLTRANHSYTSARRPPLPRARPFIIGNASLTPLFDRVLGRNHIIKG